MITAPAQPNSKHQWTDDELLRLPKDGNKYELVDGELLAVATLFPLDQIAANLFARLVPYVIGTSGVSMGQTGFRMRNGNLSVPDLSWTSRARIPGGQVPNTFGQVAPDLCVEIISPSEHDADIARKVNEYFDAGAALVWHIFPDTQTVTVFSSPTDAVTLQSTDTLTGGNLLPQFSCPVSELFLLP